MMKPSSIVDDSSSFNRLPDEVVFEILNKVIDLKSLCFCKLVSKRLSSIVHDVDKISFTVPSDSDKKTCQSFCSAAYMSMNKFACVKSLCIDLPISARQQQDLLSKWIFKFGNKGETFVFLSPNSVYDTNNKRLLVNGNVNVQNIVEEDADLGRKKFEFAMECYLDAFDKFVMLLSQICNFPLLEKVSIRDSGRRGRIYFNASGKTKIREVREWRNSLCRMWIPLRVSRCYIPWLKLPVSGYVMKGVTLVIVHRIDNSLVNIDFGDDEFEDKEEAAYCEAIMEIFKKHKGRIQNLE